MQNQHRSCLADRPSERSPAGPGRRDARRICVALACLALMPASAFAQIVPTGTPAADILLASAIADYRVFVTCSLLDPAAHTKVVTGLSDEIRRASVILKAKGVPDATIAAFIAAADPATLVPAPDTPFAEVQEYCGDHSDWSERWQGRDFTGLDRDLPMALP